MPILLSLSVLLLVIALILCVLAMAGKLPNGMAVALLLVILERLITVAATQPR